MLAKKSLGQNFLNNPDVVRDILLAGDIKSGEVVLEVGPGLGVLTRSLLDAGAQVIAVEKDVRMITHLEKLFQKEIASKQLMLIYADILDFNIGDLKFANEQKILNYKIIANIPYYITGAFLEKFLTGKAQPTHMVLMLQKEVAERIVTKDKKESILSVSVKAYGTPRIVREVTRENFDPAPEVDSAILLIENISRDFFVNRESKFVNPAEFETNFFKLVRQGFAHKRKMLSNNIENLSEEYKNKRAEELSLDAWKELYRALNHTT